MMSEESSEKSSSNSEVNFTWVMNDFSRYVFGPDASNNAELSKQWHANLVGTKLLSSNFGPEKYKDNFFLELCFSNNSMIINVWSKTLCEKTKVSLKIVPGGVIKRKRSTSSTLLKDYDLYSQERVYFYEEEMKGVLLSGSEEESSSDDEEENKNRKLVHYQSYDLNKIRIHKDLFNEKITITCHLKIIGDVIYKRRADIPITDQLRKMFNSGIGSDFTFNVDDQKYKVHKGILMTQSLVFQAMIESGMSEGDTNEATITDINPKIFKIMLEFLYTHEIETELNENEIMELLIAADKYDLHILRKLCSDWLCHKVKSENALDILLIAKHYKFKRLAKCARKFIEADSNVSPVLKFLEASMDGKNDYILKKK